MVRPAEAGAADDLLGIDADQRPGVLGHDFLGIKRLGHNCLLPEAVATGDPSPREEILCWAVRWPQLPHSRAASPPGCVLTAEAGRHNSCGNATKRVASEKSRYFRSKPAVAESFRPCRALVPQTGIRAHRALTETGRTTKHTKYTKEQARKGGAFCRSRPDGPSVFLQLVLLIPFSRISCVSWFRICEVFNGSLVQDRDTTEGGSRGSVLQPG